MKHPNLVQLMLNKVSEEAAQETRRAYSKGKFNASEVGKCPRAIQYEILKYPAEPLSPEVLVLLKDGDLHEESVKNLFSKIGTVSHPQLRINKTYKHKGVKINISGRIDFIFNNIYIVDVKGISTWVFKTLDKTFYKEDEFENYKWQLQLYMDILKKKYAILMFKDKNTSELKPFFLTRDGTSIEKIIDRLLQVQSGVLSKVLIPRPYGRDTWHCKYCQFRLPCWKLPMESRRWKQRAQEGTKDARRRAIIGKFRETLSEED